MHTGNRKISFKFCGFTIVELLVVIVVIGILAAISIVSYTGITQKASGASLASDLENASKQLKLDQVVNSAYPSTLALANGGKGISASPGTTYQYTVNNSSPQTFCITATKSGQSYFVNQDSRPTAGGCSGDWVAGQSAITNIAPNPSFESGTSSCYSSSGVSISTSASNPYAGNNVLRAIVPTGSADAYVACDLQVTPSSTYTLSFYARADTNTYLDEDGGLQEDGSGYRLFCSNYSNIISVTTTWRKISYTCNTYADSPTAARIIFRTSVTTNVPVYYDGVILTEGTNSVNFADGNSHNWAWNGTTNESSSFGPAYRNVIVEPAIINLAKNSSFEIFTNQKFFLADGQSDSAIGLSNNDQDTTYPLYGIYSSRSQSNGSAGQYYMFTPDPFMPIIGETYIFSAYVYIPIGSTITGIIISIRDFDSYDPLTPWVSSALTPGSWTRISCSYTATAANTEWRLTVADPNGVTAGNPQSYWIDGVMITKGLGLTGYVEG